MHNSLTTIGFDADDTLWENERFFQSSKTQLTELLEPYVEGEDISARLLDAERRNIGFYGYGAKSFTLSMIDTAITVTGGKVPSDVIASILAAGREMMVYPVQTLPFVRETLEALAGNYQLVLITKGDLFDQERKVAQSGLGDYFDAVEIVSEKNAETYRKLFARHGPGPQSAMMVGNSLKSDIVPALHAGSWGVHVPHGLTWELEYAEAPQDEPRFHEVKHLGEIVSLIDEINQ